MPSALAEFAGSSLWAAFGMRLIRHQGLALALGAPCLQGLVVDEPECNELSSAALRMGPLSELMGNVS